MRGSFSARADLAIDLGTATTRVAVRGKGVVLEVPTVVASSTGPKGREILALGTEAKKMLGKTPAGVEVVRPVRDGLIVDFKATEHLIRDVLMQSGGRGLVKPRLLISVPAALSEVEGRAVQDAARGAGSREMFLVPSPMAAAIGAEIPVQQPVGSLIVDVGAGRTQVAVTSLGGMVVQRSIPEAGDAMDRALVAWLRRHHDLMVGDHTAEVIKLRSGSAVYLDPPLTTRIRGRDMHQGSPRELDVSSSDAAEALAELVCRIRDTVLDALRETPPELAADILGQGLMLCGGAARLRGLDHVLRDATGLPVLLAEVPERCVATGLGRLLDDTELFERVVLGE